MIKKTRSYIDRMYRVTYRQRLHWRIGNSLLIAKLYLEVCLDFPELYKKDVSKVIAKLNRIGKLEKRRRIDL